MYLNPEETARDITPENFELLVRAYVRQHIERLTKNPSIVMLVIGTGYSGPAKLSTVHWLVGSSGEQTRGELLASCIDECNRRTAFEQSNKLMLIEHAPLVPEALPEGA